MRQWNILPHQWETLPRGEQLILIAHDQNMAEAKQHECPSCGRDFDDNTGFQILEHKCVACREIHKVTEKKKKHEPWIFHSIRRLVKKE